MEKKKFDKNDTRSLVNHTSTHRATTYTWNETTNTDYITWSSLLT